MERVRLVDWLKSERDQHVGGGLYYNSQILFAYNSNHMEGSTLSPEQTAQLFNTGALLPDNINDEIRADDVAETTNHFNAFNWVLDHVDDPVNETPCMQPSWNSQTRHQPRIRRQPQRRRIQNSAQRHQPT